MFAIRFSTRLKRRLALISLAFALAAVAASCSSGVSEDELAAVQQELTQERAIVADLQGDLDEVGVDIAVLESQVAQERANVEALQDAVDGAEAREALLETFLAWNRKDAEAFTSGYTDNGISGVPEVIGEFPIAIRRVMETTVSGDTATIHAMYALGTQRKSVLHSMVKQNGAWKIDGEEQQSPKIKGATTAVDVQLDECVFAFDAGAVTSGNVAFALDNIGDQPYRIVLNRVPEELDVMQIVSGDGPSLEGIDRIGFVDSLAPGEQINMAFTVPLDPGRYALLCFPHSDEPEGLPAATETFTVP